MILLSYVPVLAFGFLAFCSLYSFAFDVLLHVFRVTVFIVGEDVFTVPFCWGHLTYIEWMTTRKHEGGHIDRAWLSYSRENNITENQRKLGTVPLSKLSQMTFFRDCRSGMTEKRSVKGKNEQVRGRS